MSLSRAWSFYVGFILIFAVFYLCDRSHACSPMRCPCCRQCRADETHDCQHAALVAFVGERHKCREAVVTGSGPVTTEAIARRLWTDRTLPRAACNMRCAVRRARCRAVRPLVRKIRGAPRRPRSARPLIGPGWPPLPHLHRDWAHPCHICAPFGTSVPRPLGSPLPRLQQD